MAALVRPPGNELQDVLPAWVDSQVRRPGQHLGSADFVYHALRKLLELTELSLVPEGPLLARIEEAGKRFLSGLPGDQAHLLSSYLAELSASDSALSARVEVLHRPASAAGAHPAQVPGGAPNPASAAGSTSGTFRVQSPASPAPADYGASLQRLGAIMGRLEQRLAAVSSAGDEREASAAIPEAATIRRDVAAAPPGAATDSMARPWAEPSPGTRSAKRSIIWAKGLGPASPAGRSRASSAV